MLGYAMASFLYVFILLKLDFHTRNVIENVTKILETTKIVFKNSLLRCFTKKKAEICASKYVSHFFWAISEK